MLHREPLPDGQARAPLLWTCPNLRAFFLTINLRFVIDI